MNPGDPNWDAMNQPKTREPAPLEFRRRRETRWFSWAGLASPVRLNGSLRLGLLIALKVRSSAPNPNPPKTGTRTAPADSLNPPSLLNGGTPGEPQSILGRLDPLRSGLRDRLDASAPDPIPTEPAWLFGRKTHHRI